MALIVMISFSSWLIISSNLKAPKELATKLKFETSYSSMGLPNTVIFSFDASEIEAHELAIQQSWDKRRRISIDPNQTTATSVYYYPGYFRSKFIADEVVLKESDVYIKTDGWLGTINAEPYPIYLKSGDLIKFEKLTLSESGLQQWNALNQPVSFHYYTKETEISGGDFNFETRIRYNQENQASPCQYTKVVLHFSEGVFLVPIVIPGCIGEISMLAMDNFISGKENDLSALGSSLEKWQQVSISSHNKQIIVSIGDNQDLSARYEMEPGYLVGVSYQFDGVGEVDYLKLSNGSNSWQFDEHF